MTDSTTTPGYQPTDVEATRGREQGLGMGERELNQQRDVGDVVAAPEEERDFQSAAQDVEDEMIDANTAVLGLEDEDEDEGEIEENDTADAANDAGKDV